MECVKFFYSVMRDGDLFPPQKDQWHRLRWPMWFSGLRFGQKKVSISGTFEQKEVKEILDAVNGGVPPGSESVWFCVTIRSLEEECFVFCSKTIEAVKGSGEDTLEIGIDGYTKMYRPFRCQEEV